MRLWFSMFQLFTAIRKTAARMCITYTLLCIILQLLKSVGWFTLFLLILASSFLNRYLNDPLTLSIMLLFQKNIFWDYDYNHVLKKSTPYFVLDETLTELLSRIAPESATDIKLYTIVLMSLLHNQTSLTDVENVSDIIF